MATRTSVGSGPWATAGTWDTGIPADGDDVVIASGHTVTFNADQSAFTTGVKITITGTLTHATTGGPYTMFIKTGASVVGAGTWNIGTSANPVPFAVKHTITGAAGWYVDGVSGLTMTVYGAEPSIKYIQLSGDEAIGQTELSVGTSVVGDIWADGDTIRIDDINKARESEERVIAAGGIAAGTITVTSGLTAAKSTGAYISIITRNIRIIAAGTGDYTIYRVGSTNNKLTIGSGLFYGISGKNLISKCHYASVTGGAFSVCLSALESCDNSTISGGVFSGITQALLYGADCVISGGFFSGSTFFLRSTGRTIVSGGLITGISEVFKESSGIIVTGGTFANCGVVTHSNAPFSIENATFTNNTSAIWGASNIVSNCTFGSNTRDLLSCVPGKFFNNTFGSTTEHSSYTSSHYKFLNCQSEDHDGNAGALKAWCMGGVVTSQTSVKPDGYTQAYLLDPESATYPVFFTKSFSVEPGKSVSIEVQLRKDASMTYLPRIYLVKSVENPLAGSTPTDTFTMTDSTDTWESDTFSITNSTDYDQDYTLWFVAKNASGNVYSAYDITTQGGGTSSVKIMPLGRVGL